MSRVLRSIRGQVTQNKLFSNQLGSMFLCQTRPKKQPNLTTKLTQPNLTWQPNRRWFHVTWAVMSASMIKSASTLKSTWRSNHLGDQVNIDDQVSFDDHFTFVPPHANHMTSCTHSNEFSTTTIFVSSQRVVRCIWKPLIWHNDQFLFEVKVNLTFNCL